MLLKLIIAVLAGLGILEIGHNITGDDWDEASYWTGFINSVVIYLIWSLPL